MLISRSRGTCLITMYWLKHTIFHSGFNFQTSTPDSKSQWHGTWLGRELLIWSKWQSLSVPFCWQPSSLLWSIWSLQLEFYEIHLHLSIWISKATKINIEVKIRSNNKIVDHCECCWLSFDLIQLCLQWKQKPNQKGRWQGASAFHRCSSFGKPQQCRRPCHNGTASPGHGCCIYPHMGQTSWDGKPLHIWISIDQTR